MAINLSQLKSNPIRKEFFIDGEKIIVKNPNSESKIKIKEKLLSFATIDGSSVKVDIEDSDMIRFLFSELVDGIVFNELTNEEIVEIFINKSEILQDIIIEISSIIEFITKEIMFDFNNQINTIDTLLEQKKATEVIELMNKKHNLGMEIPNLNDINATEKKESKPRKKRSDKNANI